MIKCPGCGAEIEFDPSRQTVYCVHCNNIYKVNELPQEELDKVKASVVENDNTYEGMTYKCTQCGATLMTFDDTAITFCSYCGSQNMLKDKMVTHNNPDFVIPFEKTKEQCEDAYRKKLNSYLFTPNYLKKDAQIEKIRGIYMPYAIYNLYKKETQTLKSQKYNHSTDKHHIYDDYTATVDIDVSYNGLSFDLISKFYDNFSTSIPFDFNRAKDFNINYLLGYYADSYDVDKEKYDSVARKIVQPDFEEKLNSKSLPELKGHEVNKVGFTLDCESKIGMLPIYFLATRDKKNKNVHYAAVNGQTGKVACDLPIDFKKYILYSLLLMIVIFTLINNFVVLNPTKIIIFSIVSGIASLILSYTQAKKIEDRVNHLSDIGYLSKNYSLESNTIPEDYYVIKKKGFRKEWMGPITFIGAGVALVLFFWATSGFSEFTLAFSSMSIGFIWFMIALATQDYWLDSLKSKEASYNKELRRKLRWKLGKKLVKVPYFKFLYKEVIGIILAFIALFSNQANDLFYYGTTILSLIFIILSFKDLVNEHNILTSSKLPQLDERGGNK